MADKSWLKISAGGAFSCGIADDSNLWCFGGNVGQFGSVNIPAVLPQQILTDSTFKAIDSSKFHACAIDSGGELTCWGLNNKGQLSGAPSPGPTPPRKFGQSQGIPALARARWVGISTGQLATCAISDQHDLWCWGSDEAGQLTGKGNGIFQIEPGLQWQEVSAKGGHVCAITTDQSLWCWGNNEKGQLGTGEDTYANPIPSQIKVRKNPEGDLLRWTQVTNGALHTCALDEFSRTWCWGDNQDGIIGNGGIVGQENVPVMITSAS